MMEHDFFVEMLATEVLPGRDTIGISPTMPVKAGIIGALTMRIGALF